MLLIGVCVIAFAMITGLWMVKHLIIEDWSVFMMALLFFLFGGAFVYPSLSNDPNGLLYISLLNHSSCIAFLTGFWLEQRTRGSTVNGGRVLLALSTGALGLLFSVGWIGILQNIGIDHQEQELVSILNSGSVETKFLSIVFVVVVAPICEELLFRRLLLSLLEKKVDSIVSVWASGIIFGMMHIDSITSVPPLIVFGVLLGWLQIRYRNVLLPIIAHMTNNLIVVLLVI
jgi:membrane protease YdiL (CAAX protease family)